MRIKAIAVLVLAAVASLSACTSSSPAKNVTKSDQQQGADQQQIYRTNQPIPKYDWSQYLQTLIDMEGAQVHGVATTSFFFNAGVRDPIEVCPSIGFQVPSTSELTNPLQLVSNGDYSNGGTYFQSGVIGQQDPNGAFTGNSSGSYVVCVGPGGRKWYQDAEENAHVVGGPAHWDPTKGIVMDGVPSVTPLQKGQKATK
jgi:hypothetical protein